MIQKAKAVYSAWKGLDCVHLAAGGYEATMIPGVGANLIEFKDTDRGLNFLRTPDDVDAFRERPQVYGIPILFPPNRIADGRFTLDGRVYRFPVNSAFNNHIHGFLHTRPWKIAAMDTGDGMAEVQTAFVCDRNTDFYPFFPHSFEARLCYHLSSRGLEQKIAITNNSDKVMPLGLGYHTSIRIPFHPDSRGQDYSLKISVGKRWVLNERVLPTGELAPLTEKQKLFRTQGVCPLGEPMDAHYTAEPVQIGGKSFHGAIIEDNSRGIRLIYEVGPGFRHWMLWNRDGKSGFICPEPQTWVINAPNVSLPNEVTGMLVLRPGDTWSDFTRLYAKEI